jgi:N-acetylglucosaminyl-diphospho-decaprenol L-rhamnosyltransferase
VHVLSAIIVVYRTPAELAAAIASLRAQEVAPDEVIVVDNGAADSYPLPASFSQTGVRVERPPANVGFGTGCNLGAELATGDLLLIMNADIVLTTGSLQRLVERLSTHDSVAAVGPRILSGGRIQPSARTWPGLRTGLFGRRSLATRMLLRAGRVPTELRPVQAGGGEVDWISGACMLIRRSAWSEVGGFDPRYWMYWEDADFCRRLAHRGWKVVYEPAAVIHHATGASGTSERTIRAFHESAARFATQYIARNSFQRLLIKTILRLRTRLILSTTAFRG